MMLLCIGRILRHKITARILQLPVFQSNHIRVSVNSVNLWYRTSILRCIGSDLHTDIIFFIDCIRRAVIFYRSAGQSAFRSRRGIRNSDRIVTSGKIGRLIAASIYFLYQIRLILKILHHFLRQDRRMLLVRHLRIILHGFCKIT